MKGLDAAGTNPHGAVNPGLSLRHDEMGLLQCLYMERGGGQGDVQNRSDFLQGARGISQHIQDFQTKRRREGFAYFRN